MMHAGVSRCYYPLNEKGHASNGAPFYRRQIRIRSIFPDRIFRRLHQIVWSVIMIVRLN